MATIDDVYHDTGYDVYVITLDDGQQTYVPGRSHFTRGSVRQSMPYSVPKVGSRVNLDVLKDINTRTRRDRLYSL